MIKVIKLHYFLETSQGVNISISGSEYHAKMTEYFGLCWDYDEYSRNCTNGTNFVQYENCTTFYCGDYSVTLGYSQKEIFN